MPIKELFDADADGLGTVRDDTVGDEFVDCRQEFVLNPRAQQVRHTYSIRIVIRVWGPRMAAMEGGAVSLSRL